MQQPQESERVKLKELLMQQPQESERVKLKELLMQQPQESERVKLKELHLLKSKHSDNSLRGMKGLNWRTAYAPASGEWKG